MSDITRREMLKYVIAAAGLSLASWPLRSIASAVPVGTPDIVICKGESAPLITEAAMQAIGGMKRFISRGDIVLVKPNIAWDRVPEQAANTNPEVVETLVQMCLEAGAKEVKVFDNPCEDARRTYVRSGIMEAAKKAGARVTYTDERRFRKMDIRGEILKEFEVYQEAVEVDKVINVPILKHHSLARLTMGMKNLMGLIGGSRARLHWNLDQAIVDLAAFFKPTLIVLDAVRVLTANGPQGGSLKYVKKLNTVAVSRDQVAVEALGATLFGLPAQSMDHIKLAFQRGLGQMDLARLKIKEVTTDS
jgi:uncharacterized protein (DUF362 family)